MFLTPYLINFLVRRTNDFQNIHISPKVMLNGCVFSQEIFESTAYKI